jgi:hypothetical protein
VAVLILNSSPIDWSSADHQDRQDRADVQAHSLANQASLWRGRLQHVESRFRGQQACLWISGQSSSACDLFLSADSISTASAKKSPNSSRASALITATLVPKRFLGFRRNLSVADFSFLDRGKRYSPVAFAMGLIRRWKEPFSHQRRIVLDLSRNRALLPTEHCK